MFTALELNWITFVVILNAVFLCPHLLRIKSTRLKFVVYVRLLLCSVFVEHAQCKRTQELKLLLLLLLLLRINAIVKTSLESEAGVARRRDG